MNRPQIGCALLYAATSVLLPLALLALYAFSQRWFFPQLLPDEFTAAPLLRLLTNPRTRDALLLSGQVALIVTLLALLVGYPAARALALYGLPGRTLLTALLLLPTVLPPIAVGIGLNSLFLRAGLAGTLIGVCLVHLIPVLPYVILTLTSMFARYDVRYEEQARVLGAGNWTIFWQVTLPLTLPAVVVAALFAFLISWSEYLLTLLIGGGRVITLPVLLVSLVAGGNPTTIAGVALIIVAVPAVAILLATRMLGSSTLATSAPAPPRPVAVPAAVPADGVAPLASEHRP